MTTSKLGLTEVTAAWDAAGERPIHPLDPDSEEFWALGKRQAAQVGEYTTYGDRVMDFGCGNGRLTIPLVEMGYDVTAVDSSGNMLTKLGQRIVAKLGEPYSDQHPPTPSRWPGKLTTILSDGQYLGDVIEPGFFDVVISRAVLIHHSYADVELLVNELVRCLRPGGHFIADWPTAAQPRERSSWTDVTTWEWGQRAAVAARAGLTPVDVVGSPGHPGAPVWRRIMAPGELMGTDS